MYAKDAAGFVVYPVLSSLFAVYYSVVLVLFWRRRRLSPIRHMMPRHMFLASVFAAAFSFLILFTHIVNDSISYFAFILITQTPFCISCDIYVVISASLYLAFNRTQDQLKLAQPGADGSSRQRSIARWIHVSNVLLKPRIGAVFMLVSVSVQLLVQIIYGWHHWDDVSVSMAYADISNPFVATFTNVAIYKSLVNTVLFVILAFRLRIVVDAHGMKQNLKRIGKWVLFGFTIYLAMYPFGDYFAFNPTSPIIAALAFIVFTFSATIPVWQTTQPEHIAIEDITQAKANLFEKLLNTKPGYEAFREQLTREFAIENLLFWTETEAFRKSFLAGRPHVIRQGFFPDAGSALGAADQGSDRDVRPFADMATSIYSKFIAQEAPLQVNLSSDLFRYYHAFFEGGEDIAGKDGFGPLLFARASACILALMESNSLAYFKVHRPDIWQGFLDSLQEESVLDRFTIGVDDNTMPFRTGASNSHSPSTA
ncbi:RGS domain-containing protein [Plasmodiophora brassicae]